MAFWFNNVVLSLAFVAALWYAWETRKMRLQMIRPKVICITYIVDTHELLMAEFPAPAKLSMRNVGEGTAINVQLRVGKSGSLELETEPRTIPVLEKQQRLEVELRPASGYKPNLTELLSDSAVEVEVIASYSDVEGRQFATISRIGAGAKPPLIRER
jgi:hypothetical protein